MRDENFVYVNRQLLRSVAHKKEDLPSISI